METDNGIKDRIRALMEKENMSSGMFAEAIGLQQSTLSHILTGRNKPSLDVVMKIHLRYAYINLEWLLYGKGNMENEKNTSVKRESYPSLFDQTRENPGKRPDDSNFRKEMPLENPENPSKEAEKQYVKYVEKPPRKITEIRIFFDDNTYEIFKGEK